MCVFHFYFTTLENEEGDIGEEAYYHSCLFQEENQDLYEGKPSQCLLLYYLSLSIMNVLLLKVFQNENNFPCVNTTTINIINNFIYH